MKDLVLPSRFKLTFSTGWLYKQCYCVLCFNLHVEGTTNVMVLKYCSEYRCFKYLYTPYYPTGSHVYLS